MTIFINRSDKMKATKLMKTSPSVISFAAIGGKKENEGPLGDYFDKINDDPYLSTDSFEKGESQLQKQAVLHALDKAALSPEDIDVLFGGDLLNQCVGTTYGVRAFEMPFLGIYGACSTMTEGLLLGGVLTDGGYRPNALCAASSHFSTAERQYRFPLEMGTTTPPSAQPTATGAGALLVSGESVPGSPLQHVRLKSATIGRVIDMGITDGSNMGAAMAPAAYDSICRHLLDTGRAPEAYDAIYTGDLGRFGRQMLLELFEREGLDLSKKHFDCGEMLFSPEQGYQCGGSGCGCSASVLCGDLLGRMRQGKLRKLLFCGTGALLSPLSTQQGESIPAVCHAVSISAERS